jgi:hypothetical protein
MIKNKPLTHPQNSKKYKLQAIPILRYSLRSNKAQACGSMAASLFFYWGNLPIPQTPLETPFYGLMPHNPPTNQSINP